MAKQQEPFKVYVKREPGYDLRLTVRFEVYDGHGVMALQGEHEEAQPARVFEETDVEGGDLRGGRFIHVLPGSGRRKSYALSRLTEDVLHRISDDTWTHLDALTEYGFRYLVVPDNALILAGPAAAAAAATAGVAVGDAAPAGVAVGGAKARIAAARASGAGGAGGTKGGSALARAMSAVRTGGAPAAAAAVAGPASPAAVAAAGPAPVAAVPRAPVVSRPLPDKPTPIEPGLADQLLGRLDQQEAIAKLKDEMQKVRDLHDIVIELETRLLASEAREKDLLGVLAAWQGRETS